MFLIDRRNAIPDRRQREVPVWRDRRMAKDERLYREKVEKEWAACDPTKEKVVNPLEFYLISILILVATIFVISFL